MEKLEYNATNLSKLLYNLRETENLTKRDLANKLGIKYTTYNNYEIGRNEPTIDTLCKLADYYNVSLDYLVGRNFGNQFGYVTEKQAQFIKAFLSLNEDFQNDVVLFTLNLVANVN